MSRTVEFRPAARAEFDEAADWYEQQREGLRAEFVREVDTLLSRVLEDPLSFQIVHGTKTRRALIARFPYAVFFEADELRIIVYAIFHTSRDPMIWRGRID